MNDYTLHLVKRAYTKKQAGLRKFAKLEPPVNELREAAKIPLALRYVNNAALGLILDTGFNGAHVDSVDENGKFKDGTIYSPTWLSRGRQALSIASPIAGLIGGGMLGDALTRRANKALGFTRKNGIIKNFLGNGLRTVNTLGGAAVGGLAGLGLSGLLAGNYKATNNLYDRVRNDPELLKDPITFANTYLDQIKPL